MTSVESGTGAAGEAHPGQFFECQFCDVLFKSLDAYTSHMEVHETVFTYDHICTVCGKQFSCKEELYLHSRLHADLKPYKCKLCSHSFRLARSLEYHLHGHGGGQRAYLCTMCDATFQLLSDIHEHLRDHQLGRVEVQPPQLKATVHDENNVAVVDGGGGGEGEDKFLPNPELEQATTSDGDGENNAPANVVVAGGDERCVGRSRRRSSETNASADGPLTTGATQHVKLEGATVTTTTNGGNEGYDEEAVFARAVNMKKLQCNLCNKKMATRKSLNTHYKSVHMKNAHTCSVCRTSFLFSRLLDEHTQRRKRIIQCEFCDLRFCSMKRWDSHIAKHRAESMAAPTGGVVMYPRAVPLSSSTSRQSSSSQQAANNNNNSNANATAITNTNNNNNNNSQLRQSLLKSNNNNSANSAMGIKSNRSSSLLVNQQGQSSEHNPSNNKFPCDSCGKIFLSQHYLDAHMVKRQNANFQFQCDICEHRFSKKAILDEHKVYHDQVAARKKVVPKLVIDKQRVNGFSNSNSSRDKDSGNGDEEMDYDRHIIKLSDQSFKCNCCHRTFKAVNHLKCHLRYTHMKKSFKCRSCNQQFPFYKLYLAHMKHSKLCERCDKRICAKFDFKIHTQKCRGTAKMRNSTGNIAVQKSSIVEIKDDDEEEEFMDQENQEVEDDSVMMEAGNSNGQGMMQQLHSSLMLPNAMDLMDSAAADYPSIPHFLMDDILGGDGAEEFKCEPCGKVFSKDTSLHMHSFQHDPNKEMKCIFCNFLFLQRSSLNRHYRCRNTLHTCPVCKEAFCSHLALRQHVCPEGGNRGFIDINTAQVPGGSLAQDQEEDQYLEVDMSEVKEGRKRNRSGQVVVASGGNGSARVGVNSEDVSGRDESIELSDTEPDSLACMLCPLVLNTKAEVDHHVATEHGTVTKCTVCFKGFRSPTILHIHMLARASKKNKIECPNCSHRFNKQLEFRKHFMYHTLKENRPEMSDEAIYSRIASKFPGK